MKHAENKLAKAAQSEHELLETHAKGYSSVDDAWRVLRIQSEIVDGFENLKDIPAAVSIFGSARMKKDDPYYALAIDVARELSDQGFTVITGGGPGVMQAANKGAAQGEGTSVGLNIELPFEQAPNPDQDIALEFRYFFVRKLMFVRYAFAYMFFPGGFGTLDELYDVLTLMQTGKIDKAPVILVGREFWQPMLDWLKDSLVARGFITSEDFEELEVKDDKAEIMKSICKFAKVCKFEY